ncbi:hypothetical protein FQN60_000107 [Etheostoma spectabile]|uniref:PHD-type domain-containing protein n=1 Tax=Etheostoma spectabile TaxID=54343 RepID=A0A5J5C8B0_9PERO|nr:hypothetical protein FQN60_000107 [Etheostoma spectabile]
MVGGGQLGGANTDWSNSSSQGDIHEDFCTVCRRSGQLLMCDTCSRVFHLDCLDPPLKTIPKGMWICPKCQDQVTTAAATDPESGGRAEKGPIRVRSCMTAFCHPVLIFWDCSILSSVSVTTASFSLQILKKEEAIPWPGTLAIVHSYIAYKEAKEEEKQKLMKWSCELKLEREQLEQRVKQLSNSITKCMETKNSILARQKDMHHSLEKVKHLIRLIQAFSFNQALAETDGKDVGSQDRVSVQDRVSTQDRVQDRVSTQDRVQDGASDAADASEKAAVASDAADASEKAAVASEAAAASEKAAAEANSVEKAAAGSSASNSSSNADGNEKQHEHDATGSSQAAGSGDAGSQAVLEDSGILTAETSPGTGVEGQAGPGEGAGGGGDEVGSRPESEAAPPADIPVPSASVATTNGTAEPAADHSPAGACTNNGNTPSENKMAAANPAEMAVDQKRDEITDRGGSSSNNSNSKTSEPSQHWLPALVSSLDNKK